MGYTENLLHIGKNFSAIYSANIQTSILAILTHTSNPKTQLVNTLLYLLI